MELPLKGADQRLPESQGCQGSTGCPAGLSEPRRVLRSTTSCWLHKPVTRELCFPEAQRSLSRHLKGSSIQSCLSCLCQEFKVKEMPGSCPAAAVQRQILLSLPSGAQQPHGVRLQRLGPGLLRAPGAARRSLLYKSPSAGGWHNL